MKSSKKTVTVKAKMELFGKIAIISQTRKIDLPQICVPIGPLLWSLSNPMGDIKKANKAGLLHRLEGSTKPESDILDDHAYIIEIMVLVRQIRMSRQTFAELALSFEEVIAFRAILM